MAYVREKKVPGKDGKTYGYYQLVEGKRGRQGQAEGRGVSFGAVPRSYALEFLM